MKSPRPCGASLLWTWYSARFDRKAKQCRLLLTMYPALSDRVRSIRSSRQFRAQPAVSALLRYTIMLCDTTRSVPIIIYGLLLSTICYLSVIPSHNPLIAPEEAFARARCQDHQSHFLMPLHLLLCLRHLLLHWMQTQRIPYCFD